MAETTKTWKLLHLTDLHLGAEANYVDDDKSQTPLEYRQSTVDRLCNLLDSPDVFGTFDAILVTGDITNHGLGDGHVKFRDGLHPLLQRHVRSNAAICVVPGNHDVVWGGDQTASDYYSKKFKSFEEMVRSIGATTCLFPVGGISSGLIAPKLKYRDHGNDPIYLDEKGELLVLCINSAIRCGEVNTQRRAKLEKPLDKAMELITALTTHTPDKHIGRLHEPVPDDVEVALSYVRADLEKLKKELDAVTLFDIAHALESQLTLLNRRLTALHNQHRPRWNEFLKVAILHHHLLPFPDKVVEHKPFDLMLDSAAVLRMLESHGFHLVLTGHQHQNYDLRVSRPQGDLLILGGTTVGGYPARGDHAPPGFRHLVVTSRDRFIEVSFPSIALNERAAIDSQRYVQGIIDANAIDPQQPLEYEPNDKEKRQARLLRRGPELRVADVVQASSKLPPIDKADALARETEAAVRSTWGEYRAMRSNMNALFEPELRINRVYAIDHFEPAIWAAPEAYYWLALQARQYVKHNYLPAKREAPENAPAHDMDVARSRWMIQFSPEVLAGVRTSLQNNARARGMTGISLTQFDDLEEGREPFLQEGGVPRCEVARILVWEREWLERDYVMHLIASHSAFNIPLYFVDRDWAVKNRISLDFEYLLLASKNDTTQTPTRKLHGTVWHRPGARPQWEEIGVCLEQPLKHFYSLLAYPALLFAADARWLMMNGKWDDYIAALQSA